MDPLSITAAIVAFLHVTRDIKKWTLEYIHALEERKKISARLGSLESYILKLRDSLNGNTNSPWYKDLRQLISECGERTQDGGIRWQPERNPNSPMIRLHENLETLAKMMNPTDKGVKIDSSTGLGRFHAIGREHWRRFKWHWDKDKFNGLLNEIMKARDDIEAVICLDQIPLLLNTNMYAEGAFSGVQTMLEAKQQKRETLEKEKIEQW